MSKLVISSIPKSGTYFMNEILSKVGSKKSDLHLGTINLTDYSDVSLETARKSPKFKRILPEKAVSQMGDGFHAVGHLPPSVLRKFKNVNIGFLYRNLRDVIVSYARWIKRTGRWDVEKYSWAKHDDAKLIEGYISTYSSSFVRIKETFECFSMDIPKINYETLMGDYGDEKQVEDTFEFISGLGIDISKESIKHILQECNNTDTLTKSSTRSDWESVWSDRVENVFKKSGLIDMNEKMGYEL